MLPACPGKIGVWARRQLSFEKAVGEAVISRARFQLALTDKKIYKREVNLLITDRNFRGEHERILRVR